MVPKKATFSILVIFGILWNASNLPSVKAIEVLEMVPTVAHGSFVNENAASDLANDPYLNCVGMVQQSNGFFSGVLISNSWILTAAHAISSTGGSHNLVDTTFVLNGTNFQVDFAEAHPDWRGNSGGGNDLALIRLKTPVNTVSPASLSNQPHDLTGTTVTFAGYGLGGNGITGFVANTGGTKRAGTNQLDLNGSVLGMDSSIYLADFDSGLAMESVTGSANPSAYESILTPGDSGGGMFMLHQSQYVLVGVNSFVASTTGNADGRYGNLAGFQSIEPHLAWIQSVTQVPEPASIILGIICALVGWWLIDHHSSKSQKPETNLSAKPKRIR
jgi:hypothetical protein